MKQKTLRALPLFILLFAAIMAFPSLVQRLGDLYNYRFGFFGFLELRTADAMYGDLNLFRIMSGARNFDLNLGGLAGCVVLTFALSFAALGLARRLGARV